MAHNINRNALTGQDAFFSVKQKAWHGLGQIVQDYPTAEEAIKFAGLNYDVVKRPLFTYNNENADQQTAPDGIQIPEIEIENYFATVRTDTNQVLGVVGSKYEIIQNREAFTFFDELVKDSGSGIQYETAGALGNGERIFITAKMPNVIKVGRKDVIEEYIFLTKSHDGSSAIMAAFTPVRIVCNNTLNAALKTNSNAVYIKHTASAGDKLKEAARIMKMTNDLSEQLEATFNRWSKVRLTDTEIQKLIRLAMSPNKEVATAIIEDKKDYEFSKQFEDVTGQIFEYSQTHESQLMETTAGTLFGAYNSISGYYQNVKTFESDNTKMSSIFFGTAGERSAKAFEICSKVNQFLN